MSAETNKQVYRQIIEEGFNRGNVAHLDRIIAADLKEHEQLPAGIPPGLQGLKTLITAMRTAFPDLTTSIDDITADGDKVWARLTVRGTNTGEFMGMPPTRKAVTFEAMDIVRFAGEKVVEHWGITDNLAMLTQLGVVALPWETAEARR